MQSGFGLEHDSIHSVIPWKDEREVTKLTFLPNSHTNIEILWYKPNSHGLVERNQSSYDLQLIFQNYWRASENLEPKGSTNKKE